MTHWADEMDWMNPPPVAEVRGGALHVTTGAETDFWRTTFYGFVHDNGHFLGTAAEGDFAAEVTFEGRYEAQYDQAGLMIRADAQHWIKAGIEHVGGVPHLAVVVTLGTSDWCQIPMPELSGPVDLRVTRSGDAVWVQYRAGQAWVMLRLCHFPPDLAVQVGPMCASPSRAGFEVAFTRFDLGAAGSRQIY